ncbi:MAG: dockerin type I domain-containing protein, partial [Planctomycetia bacterium]|nr:dockerin type I domain-containing protein [Planctomycetia bacterium]
NEYVGILVTQFDNVSPSLVLCNSIVAKNGDKSEGWNDVGFYVKPDVTPMPARIVGYNVLSSFTGWTDSVQTRLYNDKLPLFNTGEYTLAEGSQAIGLGNGNFLTNGENELLNDLNGLPFGENVDLGAYQYTPTATFDITGNGRLDIQDITNIRKCFLLNYSRDKVGAKYYDYMMEHRDIFDINADGRIDAADITILRRYLLNWGDDTILDNVKVGNRTTGAEVISYIKFHLPPAYSGTCMTVSAETVATEEQLSVSDIIPEAICYVDINRTNNITSSFVSDEYLAAVIPSLAPGQEADYKYSEQLSPDVLLGISPRELDAMAMAVHLATTENKKMRQSFMSWEA